MDRVADRGGPAGCAPDRGGRSTVAPGTGPRKAGSSPIGGALSGLALGLVAVGLWLAGSGLVIHAKAALAQVLLQQAWQYTQVTGAPLRPWPWADTRPIARLAIGDRGPGLFVLAGASGRTLAFGPGHHDDSALPGTSGNARRVGASRHALPRPARPRGRRRGDHRATRRHARRLPCPERDGRRPPQPRAAAPSGDADADAHHLLPVRRGEVPGTPLRYVVVATAE